MRSNTIHDEQTSTVANRLPSERSCLLRRDIWSQWIADGEVDLVTALRDHPDLRHEQSLLLELATDEYESKCDNVAEFNLAQHCKRFEQFGQSLHLAIQRRLDVQAYLDKNVSFVTWPSIGEECGGFRILELIGKGASSRVYICKELDAGDRLVVLKVSPFTSFEASILGRLNHPNVTPLYSTGEIEGADLNYVCMPFLGRSTLVDVVDLAFGTGPPPIKGVVAEAALRWYSVDAAAASSATPTAAVRKTYYDEVLDLAIQVARALEAAHHSQITHGDLKPSNILLTPGGQPILLDFNLSQDFKQPLRVHGGTLAYMPPESLVMLRDGVNHAASSDFTAAGDIFSFGALLCELLTGLPPVPTLNVTDPTRIAADKALRLLRERSLNICQTNPYVSRRVSESIDKCLSYSATDRYRHIRQVREVLECERRLPKRLARFMNARPIVCGFAVGAPVTLIAAAVLFLASQPASYLRDYRTGVELLSDSQPRAAADYLVASLEANPRFTPARYGLGRARLAIGEVNLAMSDFATLSNREAHGPSTAYLAYCYNLKQMPAAAIPLYERAIQQGQNTRAIHNNLAASYIDGTSYLSPDDRLKQAERNLQRALELTPSRFVRLNYLRLAIKRYTLAQDYSAYGVWEHASQLLEFARDDDAVRYQIHSWWSICREKAPKPQSSGEANAQLRFADIWTAQERHAAFHSPLSPELPARKFFYIEPLD